MLRLLMSEISNLKHKRKKSILTILHNITKQRRHLKPTLNLILIDPQLMEYLFDSNLEYYRKTKEYK
jgi:hypothetical protein